MVYIYKLLFYSLVYTVFHIRILHSSPVENLVPSTLRYHSFQSFDYCSCHRRFLGTTHGSGLPLVFFPVTRASFSRLWKLNFHSRCLLPMTWTRGCTIWGPICGLYVSHMCFLYACSFAGLHCVTLSGWAKGVEYKPGMPITNTAPNHSWNAVYIDGSWQLVDSHWATRYLQVSLLLPVSYSLAVCEIDDNQIEPLHYSQVA